LDLIRSVRAQAGEPIASRMKGMLQTTWCGAGAFIKAYLGEDTSNRQALEAAQCFRELFRELRAAPADAR
jgi:hypothetical protein